MSRLLPEIEDAPLYLHWVRQGKLHWNQDWLDDHGPARSHIPGLAEHISFANYDLRLNGHPTIETDNQGRPFVTCVRPMTAQELKETHAHAIALIGRTEADAFMQANIYRRLRRLAGMLDVVAHHGFEPAMRSAGLDYLRSVYPRQELRLRRQS
ncbi:hypothetical protein [Amycolatopsis sp. NBC_01286]|uniref:hypothetical protein n=1 Tax=Amycolatopsis sp. NBC_01286 TaxID=2903560 RepID=UPI002E1130D3|nr:hypothetical protein OG570_16910 [Amycolatopsis sp. NBC_01286]